MDNILKEKRQEQLSKEYSENKAKKLFSFIQDEVRSELDGSDFNLFLETILEDE